MHLRSEAHDSLVGDKLITVKAVLSSCNASTDYESVFHNVDCYVQNSVCTQSRCSMFTGLYPHVSGRKSEAAERIIALPVLVLNFCHFQIAR